MSYPDIHVLIVCKRILLKNEPTILKIWFICLHFWFLDISPIIFINKGFSTLYIALDMNVRLPPPPLPSQDLKQTQFPKFMCAYH